MWGVLIFLAIVYGVALTVTGIAAVFVSGNKWLIGACWVLFPPLTLFVYLAGLSDIEMGGTQ
jgi:hypothetical protein